ncbi:DUF6879 family protein [Promicromonospora sp. NPDC057488]|uniref:DUF6879 family protein n=1 Tax=Promicromonospora sp. NPDC057488 TaxID=3346147 RepID=UPI00366EE10A
MSPASAQNPPAPDLGQLFAECEHTAFRLELLERYNSPNLREPLRRYLADGTTDMAWLEGWLATIRERVAEGKIVRRVRVVSLPLSDYNRFGLWTAAFNNEAGEDIRYLARDDAAGLPEFDHWLFDSRRAARMSFDDGVAVSSTLIDDPNVLVELNHQRDAAWHRSVARDEFAVEHLDRR